MIRVANLYRMDREGPYKGKFDLDGTERDSKVNVRVRGFQAEGTASAKGLRHKHAWFLEDHQ